jgi:hypothetical protein
MAANKILGLCGTLALAVVEARLSEGLSRLGGKKQRSLAL